jgi:hypothetical protein
MSTSAVQAAILASDNFTLSSGTDAGTASNTSSTGIGTYSTIQGTNGMTVTAQAGFGSGNVISFGNNTNTYYRAFDSSTSLTLGSLAANQTLSLSFNVRFDGGAFSAAQNFSFGFVNNTSANSILYANVNLNSGTSEFRYRTGSFNMSDGGTQTGAGWTEPTTISTTAYTFKLDVTKQANGSYLLEYYRDGVRYGNLTETSGGSWATAVSTTDITGIAFRHSQIPGVVTYVDNVSAGTSSAIPEPSTFALLGGLGALGFAFSIRRR